MYVNIPYIACLGMVANPVTTHGFFWSTIGPRTRGRTEGWLELRGHTNTKLDGGFWLFRVCRG